MLIQTNEPTARIFVDDQYVGSGRVDVKAMGLPKTSVTRVEHNGQVVERRVKRRFTVKTAFLGLVTAYTGLLWGWSYPEAVTVHLQRTRNEGWGQPIGGDAWAQPMYPAKSPTISQASKSQQRKETLKVDGSHPSASPQSTSPIDPWNKPMPRVGPKD